MISACNHKISLYYLKKPFTGYTVCHFFRKNNKQNVYVEMSDDFLWLTKLIMSLDYRLNVLN